MALRDHGFRDCRRDVGGLVSEPARSRGIAEWTGVPLRDLPAQTEPPGDADHVVVELLIYGARGRRADVRHKVPGAAPPAVALGRPPGRVGQPLTSRAERTADSRAPSIQECLSEVCSPAKCSGPSVVVMNGCSSVNWRGRKTAASPSAYRLRSQL